MVPRTVRCRNMIIYIFKIRKLQFCRVPGGGGLRLQWLQSWTALTADQLHFSPTSTPGWGVWLQWLQSWTALTADQLHFSPTSTPGWGGGWLQWLQSETALTSAQLQLLGRWVGGGGVWLQSLQSWTALTADQLHFSPTSTPDFWGVLTAVTLN